MPNIQSDLTDTEIVSGHPNWLTRSGSGILLGVLLGILLLTFLIKYPETIIAKVTVIPNTQPVLIISKSSGQIFFNRGIQGKHVLKDEILGHIRNDVDLITIKQLKHFLSEAGSSFQIYPIDKDNQLGSFRGPTKDLNIAIAEYNNFIANNTEEGNITSLSRILTFRKQMLLQQESIIANEKYRFSLAKRSFRRDSLLYTFKVLAEADYEKSLQNFLTIAAGFESLLRDQISQNAEIQSISGQLIELKKTYNQKLFNVRNNIEIRRRYLEEKVQTWEYLQLIKSPIDGEAQMHKIWENTQAVKEGNELLYVLPKSGANYAFAYVNQSGFGKVQIGQDVLIKLNDFPYLEFGVLNGKIDHISPLYTENGYLVKISLPDGSQTSYRYRLDLNREVVGTCEIVVVDMRLIERLFLVFKYVFSRQQH